MVLAQDQWDTVNEFLSIAKSYAQADVQGATSLSLLMYGPPGTGKSRLARYVAKELGLELYVARLDGLISSFLGSTSKNIRALFDFAARRRAFCFSMNSTRSPSYAATARSSASSSASSIASSRTSIPSETSRS